MLYVNLDECTSCTACYQPDVCPVGAIYSEEHVRRAIGYVEHNPTKEGRAAQRWTFVQPISDQTSPRKRGG